MFMLYELAIPVCEDRDSVLKKPIKTKDICKE